MTITISEDVDGRDDGRVMVATVAADGRNCRADGRVMVAKVARMFSIGFKRI